MPDLTELINYLLQRQDQLIESVASIQVSIQNIEKSMKVMNDHSSLVEKRVANLEKQMLEIVLLRKAIYIGISVLATIVSILSFLRFFF